MQNDHKNLTNREKEILSFISNGYTNAEISTALKLSLNTVKVHIKHIYQKLDVTNRTEAAVWQQNQWQQITPELRPLLILDTFLEKHKNNCPFFHDKNFFTQLQANIMQLLSARELFSVCLSSAAHNAEELRENYYIRGHIEDTGSKIQLSIRLETYPQNFYLWSGSFIADKKTLNAKYSASQIVSSIIYHLMEKETARQVSSKSAEKTIFQKLILSFHLLNQSTAESINAAKNLLDEILLTHPNHPVALYNRCITSYLNILINNSQNIDKDYSMITYCCKKANQISRNNTKSYYMRGLCLLLQKNRPMAIKMFEKAVSLDTSFQEGYLMLAQLYTLAQDKNAAQKYLSHALSLCLDYRYKGNNLISIGMIYFLLKKYDIAVKFLEENFCVSENHTFETLLYSSCLYMTGNTLKAKNLIKEIHVTKIYLKIIMQFLDEDSAAHIQNIFKRLGLVVY